MAAASDATSYFLNYLAGEVAGWGKRRPPLDDYRYAWIKADWEGNRLELPIARDDL
ncbi:MAG: hypothetical protein H6643_16305 [Caldilineaceae bacterium]|nr:hypothetical protein [Caldilineaceae bacterium]